MSTLTLASDLYIKPALNAIGGSRWSYRTYTFGTTELTNATSYIWAINVLPAGHRLVGGFIEVDQIDSGATATATITVGILNSYYNQPVPTVAVPAWYNGTDPAGFTHTDHGSKGSTDITSTVSALVTSENIITTATIGQGGGRINFGTTTTPSTASTLQPSQTVGVNPTDDRIIAFTIPTAPATPVAGKITVAIQIDRDQSGYST